MIEVAYALSTVLIFCIGLLGLLALAAFIAEMALSYFLKICKLYHLFVKFIFYEVRREEDKKDKIRKGINR